MCGVVGLHLLSPLLYPRLGELLTNMNGAEPGGVAVYGDSLWSPERHATVSIVADDAPETIRTAVEDALGAVVSMHDHAPTLVLHAATTGSALAAAVTTAVPHAEIIGQGQDATVFASASRHVGLVRAVGWQGIAGTRPWSVGPDQCVLQIGEFTNGESVRRDLEHDGVVFGSDSDAEVAARFVAAQIEQSVDLEKALALACDVFDGDFTLLATTSDSLAVVRATTASEPVLVAEAADWVAVASGYPALAGLPDIATADVHEVEADRVHAWWR